MTLIFSAVLVDLCLLVEHGDDGQAVTVRDGIVVRVVTGRDLERAGAKLHADVFVRDHRDLAPEDGHNDRFADEFLVALIVRVNSHRRVAKDGFGTDGCHRDEIGIPKLCFGNARSRTSGFRFEHVLEIVQRRILFLVFHLEVRDGGLESRRPVDQARSAVDQSLFIEVDKGLSDCPAQPIVQGEAFTAPVAGSTEAADLVRDDATVLALPFPGAFEEFLASHFFARHLLVLEDVAFHHELCGDARMIGTGDPQRGITLHAVVADHQVFDADEHGVADVQFAGHVRRRDGDDERLDVRVEARFVRVVVRLEITARFPHRIDARLGGFEVVGFG